MKVYEAKNIRNIALLGHAGSGKTSFAEAMLFNAGVINRRGNVEDNNTISDFHEIEHERGNSVFSTPMNLEHKGIKINVLDTPGFDDFIGEMIAPLYIADTGVVFINSANGFEVGVENACFYSAKLNKPMVFIINKLDGDQSKFEEVVEEAKSIYGNSITLFQYPVNEGGSFDSIIDLLTMKMYKYSDGNIEEFDIPAGESDKAESLRNELVESVAESDENLMNIYFEEGELNDEQLTSGLKNAIVKREIFPVFCSSAKNNIGIIRFMDFVVKDLPAPNEVPMPVAEDSVKAVCDASSKCSLFVYKMESDSRLGDLTYFKVKTGTLKSGQDLITSRGGSERIGQIFIINGKKRDEANEISAGDIGATVKLKNTHINDTLHEKSFDVEFDKIEFPRPKQRTAVVPKVKGEEEKVGMALHSLHLEDPSLQLEHSKELRQLILYSQGELHLSITKWRLLNRYKVEVEYVTPRVPYRETITKQVRGDYRHKKQSGGAGQFAEVHMMIEPWYDGLPDPSDLSVRGKELYDLEWGGKLEYLNCIVGGVIDQRFLPAILKGVMEKMQSGPLTGSYVRDIRVTVYDGKMHPVDSNEAAFKTAAVMVFKSNFEKAGPKLLEPIYEVSVKVPEEFVGDVMSDLPSRRGVILGIDSEGKYQKINARMPLAELDKYSNALRSMTQARATFTSEYLEYAEVPANVQMELVDAYKKSLEEDD